MKKLLLLFTVILISISLNLNGQNQPMNSILSKRQRIIQIIKKTGFVKLPLSLEAIKNELKVNYIVDNNGLDASVFNPYIYRICGFLPDTSNYYAVVYNHPCSAFPCPGIMTIDKNGNVISNSIIIATPGCVSTPIEATSCYDSLWIDKNLRIRSISKVVGKVYIPELDKDVDICNMRKLEGYIEKNGKIFTKESDIINCDN